MPEAQVLLIQNENNHGKIIMNLSLRMYNKSHLDIFL